MARTNTLTNYLTDVAQAIKNKKGDQTPIQASEFDTEIANLPSGGGSFELPKHGIFFIDYDGSYIDAWESSTVASKTELPQNPTHTGLVAQGWNWTLNDIKNYISNYPKTNLYVGQMYATTSGLTEMDITLTEVTGLEITCNMVGNKNWGDGTTDNLKTHTYTDYGDYTITCDGTSIPHGLSYSSGMFGETSSACTFVRIGGNVTSFGDFAFNECYFKYVILPNSITSIGINAFLRCVFLESIVLPNTISKMNSRMFYGNTLLQKISIPNTIDTIGDNCFGACFSLTQIAIPDSAIKINNQCFHSCYSLHNVTIPNSVTELG